MENLENWPMLANSFVAEETEEILTQEIMTEYTTINNEHHIGAKIKNEPLFDTSTYNEESEKQLDVGMYDKMCLELENEEICIKQEQVEHNSISKEMNLLKKTPNFNKDDDDAIFDFDMDITPETPTTTTTIENENVDEVLSTKNLTSTGRPVRTSALLKSGLSNRYDDQPIDYECAILYICPACGHEYFSHEAWKRHLHMQHEFNTRIGLNFEKVDKLYHRCRQCSKHIAMHSMENLLKHKFTHLPYRCTKCRICMRQYKYRQDLLVHLRMTHTKELMMILQSGKWELETKSIIAKEQYEHHRNRFPTQLAIKEVKAHAIDIYTDRKYNEYNNTEIDMDDHDDGACVINERLVLEEDNDEQMLQFDQSDMAEQKSLLETALNRNETEKDGVSNHDLNLCSPYIMHVCPQCGDTFETQSGWQRHIENKHNFGTAEGLGFTLLNNNEQAMCGDCAKIVYNVVEEMQTHRFTHTRHRNWLRCSLCYRSFTVRKDLIRHLLLQHNIAGLDADENEVEDEKLKQSTDAFTAERDIYEPHIDYLCPQCGRSYKDKKLWRRHLIFAHRLADLKVLNFRVINESQVRCLECDKIITNAYGIHNAQQHRFTHMPHKAFIRCRICSKSYTDRKGCVKHIRTKHHTYLKTISQSLTYKSKKNFELKTQLKHEYMLDEKLQRKKEIVRTAKYLFEIVYLDEQEMSALSDNGMDDDDDATAAAAVADEGDLKMERSLITNRKGFKCQKCAAEFSFPQALQAHISEVHTHEHISKKPRNNSPQEHALEQHTADDEFYKQYISYKCPSCGKQFTESTSWRHHLNGVHSLDQRRNLNFKPISPYSYSCLHCGHIADAKLRAMQEHMFKHLPYQQYIICRLCKAAVSQKQNMIQHLQIQHKIDSKTTKFSEKLSEETILTKSNATSAIVPTAEYTHNAVDHETITYFCPSCNENFDTHYMWRRHIVSVHNLNSCEGLNFRQIDRHHYICLQCYKRVTVTHTKGAICQLQSHKFRHLPYRSFKCTACQELFVRKQMFFKHLNRMTNLCAAAPSMSSIRKLQKSVNTSSSRMLTELSPSPPPPTLQSTYLEAATDLKHETNIDKIGGFIFICPACGLDFSDQQVWREHINTIHDLGRRSALKFRRINATLHECRQCGEQVHGKKLRDLQTHQFKHMPFTSYLRCTLCKATYTHLRNMKDHMRNKHSEQDCEKAITNEDVTINENNMDDMKTENECVSLKSLEHENDKSPLTNEFENKMHEQEDERDDVHFLL